MRRAVNEGRSGIGLIHSQEVIPVVIPARTNDHAMVVLCQSYSIMLTKMVWRCRNLPEAGGGHWADWGPQSTSKPQLNSQAASSWNSPPQKEDRQAATGLPRTRDPGSNGDLLRVHGVGSWGGDIPAELPSAIGGTRTSVLDDQVRPEFTVAEIDEFVFG